MCNSVRLVLVAGVYAFGLSMIGPWAITPKVQAEPISGPLESIDTVYEATNPGRWDEPLMPIFRRAADEYGVPLDLLLVLSEMGSGFENRGDVPTLERGYGVMALRENNQGGDSLQLAASLTGVNTDQLKIDPAANILGGAAVLDEYARLIKINRQAGKEAWLPVIIRFAGMDEEGGKLFARTVFSLLKKGMTDTNSDGETFTVQPQKVSLDLQSLLPSVAAIESAPDNCGNPDYASAIWTPAESCNYSTTNSNKDTILIHVAEGSAAATISWFRNCNSQVSTQYVVDLDGTVYQMVCEKYIAYHGNAANSRSIGLEHAGYTGDTSHPEALYQGSAACVRDSCNRWGILKEKRRQPPGIIGHIDVTECLVSGSHTDPGRGWNWDHYIALVNQTSDPVTYVVESRSGGKNYTQYSEVGTFSNSTTKTNLWDTTAGIGHRVVLLTGGHQAIYRFTPTQTGTYKVFAAWPNSTNGSHQVEHIVTHAGGSNSVIFDQDVDTNPCGCNNWNLLGEFTLNAGTEYRVTQTDDTYHDNTFYMRCDAVKWQLASTGSGTPPSITQHPVSQSVAEGGNASFTVQATGDNPLSYQWQKNETNLSNGGQYSGVNTTTLQISGATTADEGNYRCVVSNAYGTATSNAATLTVTGGTGTILLFDNFDGYADQASFQAAWPVSTSPGGTLSTAQAYSSPNSIYFGTAAARNQRSFTTTTGTDANPLTWSIRYYDATGVATDRQWVELHDSAPSLTQLLAMGVCNVPTGASTYYSARVAYSPGTDWFVLNDTGAPTRSTGWHELKAVIKSTTIDYYVDGSLAKAGVVYANSEGEHSFELCRMGSGYSSTNAAYYDDYLIKSGSGGVAAPIITQHPQPQTVAAGATATFSVTASGQGTLTYQWQKNSANLSDGGHYSGATTVTLTVSSVDSNDVGSYRCAVTNEGGTVLSNEAALSLQSSGGTEFIVESRSGGLNYATNYSETTGWFDSTAKSTAAGVTAGIGSRFSYLSTEGCNAIFSFVPSVTGTYEVFVTGPLSTNTPTSAHHIITHASGSTDRYVDQNNNSNPGYSTRWNSLGQYTLNAATSYSVTITTTGSSAGTGSTALRADAVKWLCVGCSTSPPTITQDPAAQSVCPGGTATFTVAATGTGTLTYQWQKGGVNLSNGGHYSGATTTTLTVSSADANDVASYRCVVTNAGGSTNSNVAGLTLMAATSITQHPQGQTVNPGTTVTFTVTATGEGTLSYQWQKNSINLSNGGHYSGVTTATLTVSTADANDTGNYRCVVTATCGIATSNEAALTLTSPPTITQHPSAQNLCLGGTATFTVAATGTGTLTYQWQKGGVNLSNGGHYSGATTTTLTVSSADTNDVASYRCVVTNAGGSTNSNAAGLALKATTTITQQPVSQSVSTGGTATFTITATGDGTLSYQWQKNTVSLSNGGHYSGVTTATLTISGTDQSDAASYRCVVTGGCGNATSNEAVLAVSPTITQQPQPKITATGGTVTFSVIATGQGTLTYQWQKNSVNLSDGGHYSGVTTATLTVSGADVNDAGNYRCAVTNAAGTALSREASLTISPSITQHPLGRSICPGTTAAFTVTAIGQAPLSYQWQKGGVNLSNGGHLSGVTTSILTISTADAGDAGSYRCVVSNAGGSVNSNTVSLNVKAATIITQQPQTQSVTANSTATLTVAATGEGTLSYQWQKNDVSLSNGGHVSGVTTATLIIATADSGDAGNYRCLVTATCGTATSNEATLTVTAVTQPGDFDHDTDVDQDDYAVIQSCLSGPGVQQDDPACAEARLDADLDVDGDDLLIFRNCMSGAQIPGDIHCAGN